MRKKFLTKALALGLAMTLGLGGVMSDSAQEQAWAAEESAVSTGSSTEASGSETEEESIHGGSLSVKMVSNTEVSDYTKTYTSSEYGKDIVISAPKGTDDYTVEYSYDGSKIKQITMTQGKKLIYSVTGDDYSAFLKRKIQFHETNGKSCTDYVQAYSKATRDSNYDEGFDYGDMKIKLTNAYQSKNYFQANRSKLDYYCMYRTQVVSGKTVKSYDGLAAWATSFIPLPVDVDWKSGEKVTLTVMYDDNTIDEYSIKTEEETDTEAPRLYLRDSSNRAIELNKDSDGNYVYYPIRRKYNDYPYIDLCDDNWGRKKCSVVYDTSDTGVANGAQATGSIKVPKTGGTITVTDASGNSCTVKVYTTRMTIDTFGDKCDAVMQNYSFVKFYKNSDNLDKFKLVETYDSSFYKEIGAEGVSDSSTGTSFQKEVDACEGDIIRLYYQKCFIFKHKQGISVLPDLNDWNNNKFYGWYYADDTEFKNRITSIPATSEINDISLYARYVSADEYDKLKAEEISTETPSTETPSTETPSTEAPSTEAPSTETPSTETPSTETPSTETPSTETPSTEAPSTETPSTEAPSTETPSTETPSTETPSTETPSTEAPSTETPSTETPSTETPSTETPSTETPSTETPSTEAPSTVTPSTTETPSTVKPSTTEAPKKDAGMNNTKANICKVTFNANGGKIAKNKTYSTTVKKGAKYYNLPKSVKRSGYTFSGWYTKKSGGTKISSYTINKDTTYYAHWKKVTKPAKVSSVKAVRAKNNKAVTISYKKVKNANGYQLQYSSNNKFKAAKTKVIKKTQAKLTGLNKTKTYYVRVRAFKTDSAGKRVYGSWVTKKVKVR